MNTSFWIYDEAFVSLINISRTTSPLDTGLKLAAIRLSPKQRTSIAATGSERHYDTVAPPPMYVHVCLCECVEYFPSEPPVYNLRNCDGGVWLTT